jgi:pimeloyl-ACP methyl ester carboxylesterase
MPAPATRGFELRVAGTGLLRGDLLAGEDPAYVFVHGLGSVRAGEKSNSLLAHAAARGRGFLRIDQRGHGESTGRIGQVTIGELIADLQSLLEHVGPSLVVGSSLGGLVSAFAAAQRPDLVRGLCLLAPAIGLLANLEDLLDAEGCMQTAEGFVFRVEPRVLADARTLDERGLPRRLSVPTLVVHGTDDAVVPHRGSEAFFAEIPHARKDLWIVPGGDHRLNAHAAAVWTRFDELVEG